MSVSRSLFRPAPLLLACGFAFAGAATGGFAADAAAPAPAPALRPPDLAALAADAPPPSTTTNLINRLVERGVLSKEDSADLLALADADAAELRAQVALTQAALAQAAAAQARSRAVAAQSEFRRAAGAPAAVRAQNLVGAPAADTAREPAASAASAAADDRIAAANETAVPPSQAQAQVPTPRTRTPAAASAARATATPPPAEEPVPDDTVRVAYVPEVVRKQLREEIKQDVMEQAREENWASPRTFPDWVTRFRLFGDLRTRYEAIKYPVGNDNTGSFPNFNAINTGTPFDVSGTVFSPQYNVDQDRNRARLRARMGASIDLAQNITVGVRLATGENSSPVTQNQSFGLAGSGQGGNFSKYAVWLDRGFIRYEAGGKPDQDYTVTVGRFDNPFFASSVLWADDLGFDGLAISGKFPVTEDVTPFFTVGAFPVFNTDLNFASNQPAKFKSNDKWLYGAQLGASLEFSKDFAAKIGVAYYQFQNIEGKLSSPFTPLSAVDAGDTDSSRPAFAQKGNTYMALRDIVANSLNNNGTINQFQYFGLATPFRVAAADVRLDFNHFEPFQISLTGEYLKNQAFNTDAIGAIAVNNRGAPTDPTDPRSGAFLGGNSAWMVNLTLGDAVLQERWDWNVGFGYRKVESDAVVDGFNDSDFGGGGTNVKGFTFGGNLTLSRGVWLGLRWMSATQVAGPAFKNDILDFDLNAKF